jgi:glutaredoxin
MFCDRVKEFLSRNNVVFTDRNVAEDEAALAELEALGYHSTPVTLVGKEVVVGFDQAKLVELLNRRERSRG